MGVFKIAQNYLACKKMSIKKPMEKEISCEEIIKPADIINLLDAFIIFLKEYGSFIGRIGEIEKKDPDIFKKLKEFSSPEILESFLDRVPSEIAGLMLKTFIRMARVSQVKDVMALSPDQKIEHAKEIELIVKDLLEMLKEMRSE